MSRRTEIYVMAGLLILLAGAAYYFFTSRSGSTGLPGVFAADTKFQPLDVREPALRMDLLAKIRKLEYTGSHKNIFVAAPPPPPKSAIPSGPVIRPIGPQPPPPPPPLQFPGEFFGYATQPHGGRRVGFFTSGDDVLVVAEGDTIMNGFRLNRINNDSADIEEISSGRHATVQMVQSPDAGLAPSSGTPGLPGQAGQNP
ncbi:MAG TPA: hypothetical protein VEJ38_00485 [Candidatus Acidoferrales bacterium]|nr:hypothetical protein [Candidatus Acidoferrales bacterium]